MIYSKTFICTSIYVNGTTIVVHVINNMETKTNFKLGWHQYRVSSKSLLPSIPHNRIPLGQGVYKSFKLNKSRKMPYFSKYNAHFSSFLRLFISGMRIINNIRVRTIFAYKNHSIRK